MMNETENVATEEHLGLEPQTEPLPVEEAETGSQEAESKPDKPAVDRYLAVIRGPAGENLLVRGVDIADVKEKTKHFPADALQEVWYGRQLKLNKQTTVTFARTRKK